MDKYLVIFSSLPFVLGIAWFFFGGKKKKEEIENSFIEENIGNKEIIELNISGMHCAGCAAGIEGTLKNTEGIIEAKVNFATSKGLFKYNPAKISKEQIISKIKELGYSASEDLEDIEKKSS
ncbi:cation transporter [Hydrogenothermus marinus]|uniref:cation transporter n=1 Tax=Hydrogenothermus marinus TaxID=133270 RepID=UPI000EF9CC76|nr:heavy metal-associated domain-containing protein [Hydrogenothermus marinus]